MGLHQRSLFHLRRSNTKVMPCRSKGRKRNKRQERIVWYQWNKITIIVRINLRISIWIQSNMQIPSYVCGVH
jgi:hypothetical protein